MKVMRLGHFVFHFGIDKTKIIEGVLGTKSGLESYILLFSNTYKRTIGIVISRQNFRR